MTEMRRSMPQSGGAAVADAPHIVDWTPRQLKSAGAEELIITGTGFKRGDVVVFQPKGQEEVVITPDRINSTEIVCTTQPLSRGTVPMFVRSLQGRQSNKVDVKVV